MKKLLSFFAAGLLAVGSLGVISCSGDLQNNDVQPLAVTGIAGLEVVPMTIPSGGDGSEQYLTFRFSEDFTFKGLDGKDKALKDGWGKDQNSGKLTSIQFKIVPSTELNEKREPNWKVDWGGATDSGNIFVKPGADEYTALLMRGDPGTTALGPSNVQIDGAVMNEEYTIRVKYSGNKVSVKIEGVSEDPTEMKINIVGESKNFPAKDEDKKDLTYTMNKAGKVYTYQFISVADETIEFNLSNPMSGTFYASSTEDGELELESAGKKNLSYDVKKNVEYKITVDLSSVLKPTIKVESVDMLKNATVKANWKYADNFYEVEYKSPFYFQAENTDLSFTVNRISGDDTLAWGTASAIDVDGEAVELTYTEEGKAKPVVVKGLKKGDWYLVKLAENNETFTLTAKVISAPIPDISTFNSYMWSNVNNSGWGQDTTKYPYPKGFPKFVKDSTQENTFYCDFSPVDTSVEFGIKKFNDEVETDGISNWYGCGAEIKGLNTEVSGDITKGNSKIIGLEAGKNYRLYVTFLNPVIVSMKVIGK